MAITRCPIGRSTPSPTASTTPASSMPGIHGGARSPFGPGPVCRYTVSVGLTAAAAVRTRTSPGPGSGTGSSSGSSTSGPPGREKPMAVIVVALTAPSCSVIDEPAPTRPG
jgi:hypothetical protein